MRGIFQGFLWEGDLFSFALEKIALRQCWGVVGWMKKRRDTGRSFRQLVRQFRQQTTRTEAEAHDRHTSGLMDDGVSQQRSESLVSPVSPHLGGGGLEVRASDALVSLGTLHQEHRLCLLWTGCPKLPGPSASPISSWGKGASSVIT